MRRFVAGLMGALAVVVTTFSFSAIAEEAAPAPEDAAPAEGGEQGGEVLTAEQANAMLMQQLKFETGSVQLKDGLATLKLSEGDRYINPEQAAFILEEVWGNPPGPLTLGMILPANTPIVGAKSWAVVLDYEEDGYVEDDEADSINYAELLEEMQDDTRSSNAERREAGYPEVELKGWAEPPHYDAATKKLYWAKDLMFRSVGDASDEERTLNYDIRILGRRGVLVVSAVSGMGELPVVRTAMKGVLDAISFNEGHRYSDFTPGMDKVASYGIGALIAGKLASKVGLFAALGIFIVKAKKLLIIAVIGIGALLKKVFSKKED